MAESQEAVQRRLMGIKDSRSTQGIMSRGKNVYNGGTSAANNQAHKSGDLKNAAMRRMSDMKRRAVR